MHHWLFCLGLAWCVPAVAPRPVDLNHIERTIGCEPRYQGQPKYCLLVLGPEAKFRVWLVADGPVLYVDRNGDGDLTGMDERVTSTFTRDGNFGFRPGLIDGPEGKAKHFLRVGHYQSGSEISLRLDKTARWQMAGFDGPGPLIFAARPQDAPIIHFMGPLTLTRFEPQPGCISPHLRPLPLVRGEVAKLAFSVGTPGLGAGTFAKDSEVPGAQAELCFANGRTITTALAPDG